MIKRYVGLDLLDLVIHAGVTIGLAAALAEASRPDPEVAVGFVVAASFTVLAWRRARALKMAAPTDDLALAERVSELEACVSDLQATQARTLELEERLDFAERMLVQQRERDAARLGPGATA